MTDYREAPAIGGLGEKAAPASGFNWLERTDDDFPYYNGKPVEITAGQWWLVMLAVAIGFAILILPPPFLRGSVTRFVPVILYFAIPLAALAYVAPSGWTAIFRRLKGRDFLIMIVFAIINLVITLAVSSAMVSLMDTTRNAAVAGLADQSALDQGLFFVRAIPQLFGEEVMSILPFLALLYWLVSKRGMSCRTAVIVAALLVAVLFAAAHLHTYGWNVIQALAGVGVARLVLIIPYIMTKNIWVCTGAHILNDWLMFGMTLLGTGLAAGGAAAV